MAVQLDMFTVNGLLRFKVETDGRVTGYSEGEKDTGDPKSLKEFMEWVSRECPAERYLVIFWGHSSGPVAMCGDYAIPERRRVELPGAASDKAANETRDPTNAAV